MQLRSAIYTKLSSTVSLWQKKLMYKMGRLVALCHNKLRDIAGALLEQVYHDVPIEQILQPV